MCQGPRCPGACDHLGRSRPGEDRGWSSASFPDSFILNPAAARLFTCPFLRFWGQALSSCCVTLHFTQQTGSAWNQTFLPTFLPGRFAPPPFCQTSSLTSTQRKKSLVRLLSRKPSLTPRRPADGPQALLACWPPLDTPTCCSGQSYPLSNDFRSAD